MTAWLPSDYKPNGLISTEFFDEPMQLSLPGQMGCDMPRQLPGR